MGYRDYVLQFLKTGRMIKMKGQGLVVPHMRLFPTSTTRHAGTVSRKMVIDKIDSLPSRFKKLSIGKKKKGGAIKKKLLSDLEGAVQNLIIKKSSKKRTGRKASSKKSSKKSTGRKTSKRSSKKSTGGRIKRKSQKKQSFKALKFNF